MKTLYLIICAILFTVSNYAQVMNDNLIVEDSVKTITIISKFNLMAHRGGVTDGGHLENSLSALDEAISRGYTGVEIDVRESKDSVLFLYHNRTFERDYQTTRGAEELTWEEIQALRPIHEGTPTPVLLKTYLNHCIGSIKEVMVDIKVKNPTQGFYKRLENVLVETGYLENSFFIGHGAYFHGKAKITMLMREKDEFFKKYGNKTKDYYFMFAGFDEINAKTIKWCNDNGIRIIACVNRPYVDNPHHLEEAGRTASWLIEWGVTDYQLDSEYDVYFRE